MDASARLVAAGVDPAQAVCVLQHRHVRDVIDVQERGYKFRAAAWWDETTRLATAIHITDDPQRVMVVLASGRDFDVGAGEREMAQELGPGLYVSAAPQLWTSRSTGKWDFVKRLSSKERVRFVEAIAQDIGRKKADRYITASEAAAAERDIEYAKSDPGWVEPLISRVANQPYNVPASGPEFLQRIGIRAGSTPGQIEVTFRGIFAEIDSGYIQPEVYRLLRELGCDGAFQPGGFAQDPQTVIWRRRSVVSFRHL